jgi:hypothetical protein
MPRRTLRTMGAVAAAVALLMATGCGAKEAEVVSGAFAKPIDRATVAMDISADVAGTKVGVSLQGPYQANGDQLPSVDWRVRARGLGGDPVEARVISSATNAFVEYGGQTYEVGQDKIAELTRQGSGSHTPADLSAFLQQAKDWFPESDTQEDAELNGEAVTRVTGRLDFVKALSGLQELVKQPAVSGSPKLGAMTSADLAQIQQFVEDPRFTLDVAKSDGTLRRIAATMQLKGVPGGGSLGFSVQLSDVGKPVSITPPASGRPIGELGAQLEQVFGGALTS